MLNFTKLDLSGSAEYVEAFSNFDPYADYYFNNLFTWLGQKQSVEWARYKEAIVLKFINPFDSSTRHSYTYLANKSSSRIFQALIEDLRVTELKMLPAVSLSHIEKSMLKPFKVEIDHNNSDYIYDAQAIIRMKGPKSKGFLRQVNYYLKNHSVDSIVESVELKNPSNKIRLINSIHAWQKIYTHNDIDKNEAKAIERYIIHSDKLNPRCVAISIDNKIEAFSIYSLPPQNDHIILSHAKTSYKYKGLFDFLVYSTTARAIAENPKIKFLNFEQDLGIEGIRKHKLAMKPIKQLYKYNVVKI
jgi:hypothetical protein